MKSLSTYYLLSVGLGQPDDGTGMIERVLKHHGLFSLEDIADLTEADISGFFRLDANDIGLRVV